MLGGEKNLKLRQAISLAIDREDINAKVYEGTRNISTGITPPGIPGFKRGSLQVLRVQPDRGQEAVRGMDRCGRHAHRPDQRAVQPGWRPRRRRRRSSAGQREGRPRHRRRSRSRSRSGTSARWPRTGACNICRSRLVRRLPDLRQLHGRSVRCRLDRRQQPRLASTTRVRGPASPRPRPRPTTPSVVSSTTRPRSILLNDVTAAIPLNWYVGDQVYAEGTVNYDQPPLGLILWQRVGVESSEQGPRPGDRPRTGWGGSGHRTRPSICVTSVPSSGPLTSAEDRGHLPHPPPPPTPPDRAGAG